MIAALLIVFPQVAPAPPLSATKEASGKVRCIRTEKTGSLVPGTKVCKTEAEWAMERRNAQDRVAAMQSPGAPIEQYPH